ncbi:microtubule-associated protein 4 isoform X2 [Salvelinus sp. IW2-2015]|uniref:microtubule-associated protein 4 isoform X2 n=1 Tax=Salvelinus sp. IW2-2015 TaxID=2691554 RepID=UPI000CDFEC80|nr:microtubule-associated protein 4 isoform X2 [Salvelinus alpinus]
MAELDLSLSDALMDSVPQAGPEDLVERDFVAQLEAEAFDDQVGETVGKTDYIPLLDNDGNRADADSVLENGEQDAQGAQKPVTAGSKVTPGGQITASRPEPQGEVRPNSSEQQVFAALSGSMAGFPDHWSSQRNNPPQMMDSGLMGDSSGFSQPAMRMEMGIAPLSTERPPSIAEPQKPPPQAANTAKDMSAGALGDGWPDEACIPTDLPFTQSVSTVISRHASHLAASPEDRPDSGWPHREASAVGEERESNEGNDRKQQQKKKKKRRPRDDVYDLVENRGHPEAQAENTPLSEGHHRVSPRKDRDRMDGGWEREEPGRSGGRGKRGKSRKKLPEEWGVTAEPFVPSSASSANDLPEGLSEGVLDQLVPPITHSQPLEIPYSNMGASPASEEFYEGLFPPSLTQDLLSLTAPTSPPPALGCELLPTAPVSMPTSQGDFSPKGTFPMASPPGDPFTASYQDLLMDTENASMGNAKVAFSTTFPLDSPVHESGVKVVFDHDTPMHDVHMKNALSLSPTRQPDCGLSPLEKFSELTATAPPFSPSDSSWLINDSNFNNDSFEFSDITPGRPLPLGLAFDTPSPAPLRSPKTIPEYHPRKGRSPSQNIPTKSPPSSSSSTKSPTSPGSGLNPAAKPFFPSFAELTEPQVVVAPMSEVKSEKMDKPEKEETMDHFEKLDQFEMLDKLDKVEKKDSTGKTEASVKVAYAGPLDKGEKMDKMDKAEKTEKLELAEKVDKEENREKVDKMDKGDNTDKVEKMDKVEKPEETEQNIEKVEKTPEKPETAVKMDTFDKMETQPDKMETQPDKMETQPDKMETQPDKEKTDHVGKVTVTAEKETENVEKPKDNVEKPTENVEKPTDNVEKPTDNVEKPTDNVEKPTDNVEKEDKKPEKTELAEKLNKQVKVEKSEKKELKSPEKKTDKKSETADKAKKPASKPSTNGSSATPSKDLPSPDKKTKPVAGATKLSAAKPRPSSAASVSAAAPKRPTPSSTSTTTSATLLNKKTPVPKAPTPTAGPKRPSSTVSRPTSAATASTTAPREVKPKTTTERRPLVPKATAASTARTAAPKNGTATTATSKPATATRMPLASRTAGSAPATRRPLASKTDSKPGEDKKPSTLKSTTDSTRPRTSTTRSSIASTTSATPRVRPSTTKPAPSSSTVSEKKPSVPRVPRPPSTTGSANATRTTSRPGTAPAPDIRNVRSKIGSTDNMKYQPGGGKVSGRSDALAKGSSSKETSEAKVQIVSKKLDFSHVTSRLGSKDNIKHVPGGGKVQILNKKVDLSKVTSKCGSKANIKHKPGGGDVKTESQKVNYKDQAKSKVGSMDNLCHEPGGGNIKAEGAQEMAEENGARSSDASAKVPGQASSPAQENGVKEGAPCGSQGIHDPQGFDSRIPETSF